MRLHPVAQAAPSSVIMGRASRCGSSTDEHRLRLLLTLQRHVQLGGKASAAMTSGVYSPEVGPLRDVASADLAAVYELSDAQLISAAAKAGFIGGAAVVGGASLSSRGRLSPENLHLCTRSTLA